MRAVIETYRGVTGTTGQGPLEALLEVALDLTAGLSASDRYRRLVASVGRVVPADAVALLRLVDGQLEPVAVEGLAPGLMGRRFAPGEHPRLAAILAARGPVRFPVGDPLPDPYDGHLEGGDEGWTHVHSCMGCSLRLGDELIGALTVDALAPGAFDGVADSTLAAFAALAAAAMQTAALIERLEQRAERRGQLALQLTREALLSQGGELLGASPALEDLRRDLEKVAASDLTVLVTGETGTGKELVVRTLHARSPRRDQPLVYVNCAALPEAVAESELFGHRRGAFTGAIEDRVGKFELADGGTLFLDEIGELPPSLQPKLLRTLQSGEIHRVGSDQELRVDVRVLAATNRDLAREVKEGRFRADLYHRLSVYPVHVPRLADRPGDVALLAGRFLDRARLRLGLGPIRLTRAAQKALDRYPWPGNVRELEHVLTRAALRAAPLERGARVEIDVSDLALGEAEPGAAGGAPRTVAVESREPAEPLADAIDRFQRDYIRRTVEASGGCWAEAARRLDLDRGNLSRRARRLGLR